jgi:hypothetical protein
MGDGRLSGPVYGFLHDAYHPEPNRNGEGHSGSGMLYRWIEPEARPTRLAVHTIAVDDYGIIDDWKAERLGESIRLASSRQRWTLTLNNEAPLNLSLQCEDDSRSWRLTEQDGEFRFSAGNEDSQR